MFRFQHFHPLEQFDMYKDEFAQKYAYYEIREVELWYFSKFRWSFQGEANFSPSLISFHHISPYEMRFLDFSLYKLQNWRFFVEILHKLQK